MSHRAPKPRRIAAADIPPGWTRIDGDAFNDDQLTYDAEPTIRLSPLGWMEAARMHVMNGPDFPRPTPTAPGYGVFYGFPDPMLMIQGKPQPTFREAWAPSVAEAAQIGESW